MFGRESDNFMNRVSQALNCPLQSRCAELTVLFDRASLSELHNFFPVLIDNIFGPQGQLNWGLRSTTANVNAQDFKTLQHFLSPLGPLFKVIYVLLRDPHIKYDFSVAYLPIKVKQMLESTNKHPFYSDLVHVNPQTRQVTSLLLNPFDYYFFHFAYHLINPWHQRFGTGVTVWNTVYYVLCCDYLIHFLPTDVSCRVLPIIDFYCGKSPIDQIPSFSRSTRMPMLLRSSVLSESINDYHVHQPLERHPRNEIWRSETVMTVFIDMWLSNDQISSPNDTFATRQSLQFNELPTGEYIRIIRVLVKQLHAFSSSNKADDTHMSELKKIAIPMLQSRVYVFLRNLIHRWPLDGSFRLVLELWLSFIQPWRYLGTSHLKPANQMETNPDVEDIGTAPMKSVEKEHLKFIAENLLAYIVIFQQLLPRFCRVDLASPKMSLMLYRMTKVFDQPNLVPYLQEMEGSIENLRHSPTHSYNSQWNSSVPPLSPTTNWSSNISYNSHLELSKKQGFGESFNSTWSEKPKFGDKWSAIVRPKVYELEGPNFIYKPLFTNPPAQEVFELVEHIVKAKKVSQEIVQARVEEKAKNSSGFMGQIKAFLMLTEMSNDEFTLEERQKVPMHLEFSLQNLSDMFQLTERQVETRTFNKASTTSGGSFSIEEDLRFLTPEKVKERIKLMKFEGDPELLPAYSNENKFLVSFLYRLATYINKEFQPVIENCYRKENYVGRIMKQLLLPPTAIYMYDKSKVGRSQRVAKQLPPRVSFRPMASRKFLAYMIIGYLTSRMIGHGLATFLCFVFFMWLMVVLIKAVPRGSFSNCDANNSMRNTLNSSNSFN